MLIRVFSNLQAKAKICEDCVTFSSLRLVWLKVCYPFQRRLVWIFGTDYFAQGLGLVLLRLVCLAIISTTRLVSSRCVVMFCLANAPYNPCEAF